MKNFWQELDTPIMILAPMDDVTDSVWRKLVAKHAKPDVFFTEFTNVDGLQSVGRAALIPRLLFDPTEHPIVAQIWGMKPENYLKTAQEIKAMGFDGIDINMGCPVKNVVRNGTCSALIKNQPLAKEIILATIEGAGGLPVSVKTRLGFHEVQMEWIEFLLGFDLAALTVHGRTVKEMSKVPAHWDQIAEVVKLRDRLGSQTLIIGNGDVKSLPDARAKAVEFGVDGVMIGRGIFENFWIFDDKRVIPTVQERLALLLEHTELFNQTWQGKKNFDILKKFYKIYVSEFDGAKELRTQLMEAKQIEEVAPLIQAFANSTLKQ